MRTSGKQALACWAGALIIATTALYIFIGAPKSAEGAGEAIGRLLAHTGFAALVCGLFARKSEPAWSWLKFVAIYVLIFIVMAFVGMQRPAHAGSPVTCSRDDAFNRMMALNQFGMKLQNALPNPLKDPAGYEANYRQVTYFNTRLAAVGKTLAAEKYAEACASYDALAKQYKVDLAAQKVRPLAAVEKEAKNAPGENCDLTESAKLSMWLTESFQKRVDTQGLTREDWQAFGKLTEPVGLLMQQDPAKACVLIDSIADKYGFKH